MGKVGLAITTYNRIEYLRTFLNSFLESDLSKLDMICVIDDCSTENVKPLLERIKAVYPDKTILLRTRVNSQIWQTLKVAIDVLIDGGCDTLLNLDPDCIVNKDWLNKILDLHNRFPDNIVTGFNTITHSIKETHEDYYIKDTCGGLNMVYNKNTYNNHIVPSFNSKGSWDTIVHRIKKSKVIVSKPSVIQHIGIHSTMGHTKPDTALDFIEDIIRDVDIVIPSCKTIDECRDQINSMEKTRHTKGKIIFTGLKESASKNRNYAMSLTNSKITIMLDDDMTGFYDGWDIDLIKPLEDNNIVIVSSRLLKPDGTYGFFMDWNYSNSKEDYIEVKQREIPTACFCYRNDDLKEVIYDENFIGSGFEDNDMCRQVQLKHPKGKFIINNKCKLIHINEMKNQRGKY